MDEVNKKKFTQVLDKIKEHCGISSTPLFVNPENWTPGEAAMMFIQGLAAVGENAPEPEKTEVYEDGTVTFTHTPRKTGVDSKVFCRPEGTVEVRTIMTYSEVANHERQSGYDYL